MESGQQKTKAHRKPQSGPKAEKRKACLEKNESAQDKAGRASTKGRNVKAFAIQHATKTAKMVRRTLDQQTKRYHIPSVERGAALPPPMLVALVGPPGCGKSTILQCLVKQVAKQKISHIRGPVTVVVSKKKRVTFLECNNDINCMIDVAKIADMIILVIDASVGFEMPTFEFSNILHTHGMPRVLGVLTHLDHFKNNKALKKRKKQMKSRLWSEIGAKLFYLSKFQTKSGEYLPNEIRNLARFIAVKNAKPSDWRSAHPHLLVDRLEDITNPRLIADNPKVDRVVSFYGYIRGTHLPNGSAVHIPGCGDFTIADMRGLVDPCPLPGTEDAQPSVSKEGGPPKRRTLSEKERRIYAPMAGVGGVLFDSDATYIDPGGSHHMANKRQQHRIRGLLDKPGSGDSEEHQGMTFKERQRARLSDAVDDLEGRLEDDHEIRIFGDTPAVKGSQLRSIKEEDDDQESDEDEEMESGDEDDDQESNEDEEMESGDEDEEEMESGDEDDDFISEGDDEMESEDELEEEVEDIEDSDVKEEPSRKRIKMEGGAVSSVQTSNHSELKSMFDDLEAKWKPIETSRINWNRLVYGVLNEEESSPGVQLQEEKEIGGIFRAITKSSDTTDPTEQDITLPVIDLQRDWSLTEMKESIRDVFTTGDWGSEDAARLLDADDKAKSSLTSQGYTSDDGEDSEEEGGSESEGSEEEEKEEEGEAHKGVKVRLTKREKLVKKREEHKALFDSVYDAARGGGESTAYYDQLKLEADAQAKLNKEELAHLDEETRLQLEGYRPGLYVRIEFQGIPCELVTCFDPSYPVILGGLLKSEETMTLLHTRFLHHRWYKRILKSGDPLVMSVGWRRFQTRPIYSRQEDNLRKSFLKYTPEHIHCYATFYGPLVPQKTGIVALQSVKMTPDQNKHMFRIAGTASVLDSNEFFRVDKKLKLRGEPLKIFSKTAFVKGMFNSALEVSKFINAQIKTVSGIRGRIKQALVSSGYPKGTFRAGFEAPIVASDLVTCRCFTPVEVPRFFAPVTNLLLPDTERLTWQGMRTVGQIRKQSKGDIKAPNNPDSHYKPVVREEFISAPVKVSKQLQKALPYRFKPRTLANPHVDPIQDSRPALISEPEELRRRKLVDTLRTIHEAHMEKKKAKTSERVTQHKAKIAALEDKREKKNKERRKRFLALQGSKKGGRGRGAPGGGWKGGTPGMNPDSADGVASSR